MSRFDMKEFGEAAPFLRKSELELLAAHTVAFDGRPSNGSFTRETAENTDSQNRTDSAII